jgi:hypothetical protein
MAGDRGAIGVRTGLRGRAVERPGFNHARRDVFAITREQPIYDAVETEKDREASSRGGDAGRFFARRPWFFAETHGFFSRRHGVSRRPETSSFAPDVLRFRCVSLLT